MSSSALNLVRLQDLTTQQRVCVMRLSIPQEQIEYAGPLERAVAACEAADPTEVAGLAILLNDRPVGFAVLSRGSKQPDWGPAGCAALTAMRIDSAMQGKGIGKSALAAIDGWLLEHWRENDIVALCVDDANASGRRAYEFAGYREYTEPKQGRIGLVRYLSKMLVKPPSAA